MRAPATLIVSALVLWLGGCATDRAASQTSATGFALIGDMPYDGRQEKEFDHLMKDIDAAELAFVVHNGDFWWDGQAWTEKSGGLPPCSDEAFDDRLALAQRSRHPFIYAPGDKSTATGPSRVPTIRSNGLRSCARCSSRARSVSASSR